MAIAGSDMGNISAYLTDGGNNDVALVYLLDARDATNMEIARRTKWLIDNGYVRKDQDVLSQLRTGSFGEWPDLRPLWFKVSKSRLPFLQTRQSRSK
jgi:hypothetical protein